MGPATPKAAVPCPPGSLCQAPDDMLRFVDLAFDGVHHALDGAPASRRGGRAQARLRFQAHPLRESAHPANRERTRLALSMFCPCLSVPTHEK